MVPTTKLIKPSWMVCEANNPLKYDYTTYSKKRMLLEFTVKNYLSFKDEVTLTLRARKTVTGHERYNTFMVGGEPILKTAVIYGANASGKSNLIKAIGFMKEFVVHSSVEQNLEKEINLNHFKLSTDTINSPSEFEIVFVYQDIYYRYGFVIDKHRIHKEWLYYAPGARELKLFERKFVKNTYTIKLGKNFKEGQLVADHQLTGEKALFLAVVAKFNGTISKPVMDWFSYDLQVLLADWQQFKGLTLKRLKDPIARENIAKFMKAADTGIEDLLLVTVAGTEIVVAKHSVFNEGSEQPIDSLTWPLDQESAGTQKLFALSGPFMETLTQGKTLIIDELDTNLHPVMMRFLVNLFNSPERNPREAQLVCVIHDTNLLTSRFFRTDQIWFIEKDVFGISDLYSLADSPWELANDRDAYKQDYFQGKYGSVPVIEKFNFLSGVSASHG